MKVYVVIYDGDEYDAGHIYGAFSTPEAAQARIDEHDDPIVRIDAKVIELVLDEPTDKRPE
jgi:hypothetical protein